MTEQTTAASPEAAPAAAAVRRWRRSIIVMTTVLVAAIWVLLDQATKILAVAQLEEPGRIVDLGFIQLNAIRNSGGAFGLPGFPGLFVIVTVLVLALVGRALPRTDRMSLAIAYGLVTGGALGNVVDRLVRDPGFPTGAVVDFFDLRWWPVFNIADIGIVVGAGCLAILLSREEKDEKAAGESRDANPSVRPDTTTPRH